MEIYAILKSTVDALAPSIIETEGICLFVIGKIKYILSVKRKNLQMICMAGDVCYIFIEIPGITVSSATYVWYLSKVMINNVVYGLDHMHV